MQMQISLLLRARSEHSDESTLISILHPPFGLTSLLKKHFDVKKLRILEVYVVALSNGYLVSFFHKLVTTCI